MDDGPVLGVDCGGTTLRVARFEDGSVVPSRRREVATPADAEHIPAVLAEAAAGMADGVRRVGIGVAGLVDHHAGVLVWMPHAAGHHVPIGPSVAALLDVDVVVDNDATAATLAEARLGAGSRGRMVLGVFLGTGIGGGLVIDGRPERGRAHLGEIGHMVMDPAGPECRCGRRGCWEALVSGTALAREAAALAERRPGGLPARRGEHHGVEQLGAAASAGDPGARAVLEHAGEWLGRGLADLVAILDPDVVVLGGGVSALGELILGPARRALRETGEGGAYRAETPVIPAAFGDAAGLVGMALLAREER